MQEKPKSWGAEVHSVSLVYMVYLPKPHASKKSYIWNLTIFEGLTDGRDIKGFNTSLKNDSNKLQTHLNHISGQGAQQSAYIIILLIYLFNYTINL